MKGKSVTVKLPSGGTRQFEDTQLTRVIVQAIREFDGRVLTSKIVADIVIAKLGSSASKLRGFIEEKAGAILEKLFGFEAMSLEEIEYHLAELKKDHDGDQSTL